MSLWRRIIYEISERIDGNDSRTVAVFAFLFGGYGAHKFMLGYKKEGLVMVSATFTGILLAIVGICLRWDWLCVVGIIVYVTVHVVALVEGLIYLTKKDWEFYSTYVINHRGWF